MLKFFASAFAVAGLLAATGPIIIHLLNRRRFRVVEWAAMDFLREAIQRNRRVLQLRDLILLALRVLCVLLFGLALARPYFSNVSNETLLGSILTVIALLVVLGGAAWAVLATKPSVKRAATATSVLALLFAAFGVWGMVHSNASASSGAFSSRQPLHAVLIVDNSLSMGYEALNGSLLDQAKVKAADFIDDLPPESRFSIIPLCGSETGFSMDAYRSKGDAVEALERIEVVDRAGTVPQAIDLAAQACKQAPELTAKRVVFLSDQQLNAWPATSLKAALQNLPELQVVHIAAESTENVWVSDFRVQDGIADIETPTVFRATIRYSGQHSLDNVQVTLTVDGVEVGGQAVELEPGQSREVEFKYLVDVPADPGQPNFVTTAVAVNSNSVEGDRLTNDNQRYLTVPVVAGLPVLFVDQFGEDEDPEQNKVGETFRFRRLLAPQMSREDFQKQLIRIQHTSIDKLDKAMLQNARLVVVAGVESPLDSVELLRQYVDQGGPLMIAAGAGFEPSAWNELAWLDGAGILPAPLKSEPVGELPEDTTGEIKPFFLNYGSMQHDFFLLEGESDQAREDLFQLPMFFKTVAVDMSPSVIEKLVTAETERIKENRRFLAAAEQRRRDWVELEKQGKFGPDEETTRDLDNEKLNRLFPKWLLWSEHQASSVASAAGNDFAGKIDERESPADAVGDHPNTKDTSRSLTPEEIAGRSRPRVLASYTGNNLPFLVERRIGAGRLLFVSTGAYSSWNTLTKTNAILVFDRIFRSLLEGTMPERNYETGQVITLRAEPSQTLSYVLSRPSGFEETLGVDALGADTYGLMIRNALRSGQYKVTAHRAEAGVRTVPATSQDEKLSEQAGKVSEILLAINGPESESELETLKADDLKQRMGDANYKWVESGEPISLEGAQIRGRDVWKLLVKLVLFGLIVEMFVLAWPMLKQTMSKEQAA